MLVASTVQTRYSSIKLVKSKNSLEGPFPTSSWMGLFASIVMFEKIDFNTKEDHLVFAT